jgi:hypothetical protein
MSMKTLRGLRTTALAVLGSSALLSACAVEYDDSLTTPESDLGEARQAAAACAGDDVNYDFNAFAASLAVAVANELGRWDAYADFEVRNGKLELSATGDLHCAASPKGCANIIAMLRLQDDAASVVPNHSPAMYRNKLVHWHGRQTTKLKELVNTMLTVDKGVYKVKARHSGKYMAVDNGSYYDNTYVEQRGTVSQAGADEWRLILENTKHKFKNVRSGKCLTLQSDSSAEAVKYVQQTCSPWATTQEFEFAQSGAYYTIRNKFLKALDVDYGSYNDDATLIQYTWDGSKLNQQWELVPVGTGQHVAPTTLATAVYYLTAKHSGKVVGVDNGSVTQGAAIEQGSYWASDDRFAWYITPFGGNDYQLINRRSGLCLALASDSATSALVQQTCAAIPTQRFTIVPNGDGHRVIYTKHGRPLEVSGASVYNDARLVQGADGSWRDHRFFKLTPIMAGEPHRLTFSHTTNDATCGEYNFWYEIAQPNGESLRAPQDSFVQLIFAGGKEALTGSDVNPFIAQQVSGDLVGIDPTYGLNEDGASSSGSCSAACTRISSTSVLGQCCSCNGKTSTYKRSAWNATTYLCQ